MFVTFLFGGCASDDTGGDGDMYKGIEASVRELDPNDEAQIDSLAEFIRGRALKDVLKVLEIMRGEDEDAADRAGYVVAELGNLPLRPILDSLDIEQPQDALWEMRQVLKMHVEDRSQIVSRLKELLEDKSLLPSPFPPGQAEEDPVERRVCDEAYLMMRLLLAIEDEDAAKENEEVFLDMSDEERDREIERLKNSGEWIMLEQTWDE
jgi:hypothetical protein